MQKIIIIFIFLSFCFGVQNSCPKEITNWIDTPIKSMLWSNIRTNNLKAVTEMINKDPCLVHARSKDGRGI